jgi:UDPglucose--hexose-1-phosphate uridylyltransferase
MVPLREIRSDPLTGEQVVISPDRVIERIPDPGPPLDPADCPFCPGHESWTTPAIDETHRDGRWVARAFPNRRPALGIEGDPQLFDQGPFQAVSAVGAHEVIVEAPEHAALFTLPVERTLDALDLAVRRMRDLRRDRRFRMLQWFRNQGMGAGASQPHPHAQIVALPIVPPKIAAFVERARAHLRQTGRPLLAAIRNAELDRGERVVFEQDGMLVCCPFAPRHAFEVWIVPEAPLPSFADAMPLEIESLGRAMHRISLALAAVVGRAPITATALGAPEIDDRHGLGWHVRMSPRLVPHGGFEESTGLMLHSVFPERAAELLREADGQ